MKRYSGNILSSSSLSDYEFQNYSKICLASLEFGLVSHICIRNNAASSVLSLSSSLLKFKVTAKLYALSMNTVILVEKKSNDNDSFNLF